MKLSIRGNEMRDVILYLGSDVNILLNKYWDVMGKPKLVPYSIKAR